MRAADFEALLYREIGLDSQTIGSNAVARAVQERLTARGLDNLEAYWELANGSKEELQELVEAVVVPETWFFRDPGAFEAMTQRVGDLLPARSPQDPIRMLSYPCSTGEEPYSMVMSMIAAGVDPKLFAVDAVEISRRSLEIAKRGAYRKHSFRGVGPEWKARFFAEDRDCHLLDEGVKRLVRLIQGNILDQELIPGSGLYDFIFCRNVLIYLDLESRRQVVRILERLLKPDGWLFVGPSETALFHLFAFMPVRMPMAFCFKKGITPPQPKLEARAKPRALPPTPSANGAGPAKRPPAHRPTPNPQAKHETKPKQANGDGDLDEVERLANTGRLAEAAALCERHVRSRGATARGHYLMGLIHDLGGRKEEAAAAFKSAVYLEPEFAEALAHLAFLSEEQGDLRGARQWKERLRRIGERKGP